MFELIIFLVIVLPVAFKRYLLRSEYKVYTRWGNLVISFLLFTYFFSEFRLQIWHVYKNGFDSLFSKYFSENISYVYQETVIIIYLLLCFFMSGLALNLGFKIKKSRRLFIIMLPIIWIILVNYYFIYYTFFTEDYSNKLLTFILIGIVFLIPIVALYLFYNHRSMKSLFG